MKQGRNILIPKVFHRIWLGPRPLPKFAIRFGESWLKYHPDWELKLWTDRDVPPLINQREFDAVDDMGRKPDILRYELLLKYGGIYLDVDIECQKNIEDLIVGLDAFVARDSPDTIGNAIVGAVAGHPLLLDAVNLIPESIRNNAHKHTLMDAPGETGPWFFTLVVRRHPEVKAFDPEFFYPCHWSQWDQRNASYPDAYAVHRWGGTWCRTEEERGDET